MLLKRRSCTGVLLFWFALIIYIFIFFFFFLTQLYVYFCTQANFDVLKSNLYFLDIKNCIIKHTQCNLEIEFDFFKYITQCCALNVGSI